MARSKRLCMAGMLPVVLLLAGFTRANPFDPTEGWSESLWEWCTKLNDFINLSLTDPAALLGHADWAKTIFEQAWPLSNYVAFNMLFSAMCLTILLWGRVLDKLPQIGMAVLLTGAFAVPMWKLNAVMLDLQRNLSSAAGKIGPSSIPADSSGMPFPKLDPGLVALGFHLVFLIILLALAGLLVAFAVGAILMAGGLMGAAGTLSFGELGRKIWRGAVALWLIAYLFGGPTVALFRRLGQLVAVGVDNVVLRVILAIIVSLFTFLAVYGMFAVSKEYVSRAAGGKSRSSVDGHTDSDVTNRPDVETHTDDTIDASLRPMTPGDRVAQEVEVVVTETEKSDESRSLPVVTSAGKAVEFGAMVAGQPEVAVAVHAAREELEQRAPHEKPPEETTLRGYLQGARE
ncbi:MAG TPA: hypothetical protein PKV96_00050 [Candidatus Saccharimonas sp.]|jgi:hypothetical protein|nr:hypothetical protein [Candidatus Saccharimonas sp.]